MRSLAESYHEGLHHTFDIIAKHPFIGKVADEFIPGLRQFLYQSHSIFYSLHEDRILVEHILHKNADARKHFIDS